MRLITGFRIVAEAVAGELGDNNLSNPVSGAFALFVCLNRYIRDQIYADTRRRYRLSGQVVGLHRFEAVGHLVDAGLQLKIIAPRQPPSPHERSIVAEYEIRGNEVSLRPELIRFVIEAEREGNFILFGSEKVSTLPEIRPLLHIPVEQGNNQMVALIENCEPIITTILGHMDTAIGQHLRKTVQMRVIESSPRAAAG